MRTNLFIITILYSTLSICYSQNYIPIKKDSAQWLVETELVNGDGLPGSYFKMGYFVNGDTIINNKSFIKLYAENNYMPAYHIGNIFQDSLNQKAFIVKVGFSDTLLIYDLSLEIGGNYIDSYSNSFTVTRIDSINIDGIYRKRIVFNADITAGILYDEPFCIIEGIGSNAGLLPEFYLGNMITSLLTCYSEHGIPLYPEEFSEDGCNLNKLIIVHTEVFIPICLSIYPNPFTSKIRIESETIPHDQILLVLYNAIGNEIDKYALNMSAENEIDLSFLDSGIYILNIISDGKLLASSCILKE